MLSTRSIRVKREQVQQPSLTLQETYHHEFYIQGPHPCVPHRSFPEGQTQTLELTLTDVIHKDCAEVAEVDKIEKKQFV